jgi:hypothetical protein
MAIYKYAEYLTKSEEAVYDNVCKPGTVAPLSGIYRCMGCHREVASNQIQPLPPQNHHQHTEGQGDIRWRLIVYADHRPK